MKIETEQHSDIAVLIVTEELIGDEAEDLVSTIQQILDEGTRKFVVDLSEVRRMDSTGIGSLIQAAILVKKRDGRLVLVHPEGLTSFSSGALDRCIVDPVPGFDPSYRSIDEAIEALQQPVVAPDQSDPGTRRGSSGCLVAASAVFLTGAGILISIALL